MDKILNAIIEFFKQLFKPTAKSTPAVKQDLSGFYADLKGLFPKISASQKEGIENILANTKHLLLNQRAYLLATTYHETARTMQPITEYGGIRYFDKYDVGRIAKNLGNTPEADGDGYLYRGRGYVQITGKYNYTRASKELGVDLVKKPELALDPKIAVQLLIRGTMDGWYGRKLTDYVNATKTDYFNARRSVNGTDRAGMIAGYADQFEKALRNHPGV